MKSDTFDREELEQGLLLAKEMAWREEDSVWGQTLMIVAQAAILIELTAQVARLADEVEYIRERSELR